MNADLQIAKARLASAAHAKDQTRCRRWLLIIGAVALLALVSFATIDYWVLLPLPLRYGTSLFLVMVAGLGAWRWRSLFQRPTSLKEAALDAETLRKETDCVVSTAAEYANGKAHGADAYEPELAVALQLVAAERLETVQVPYARTLRWPLTVLGAALAALIAFIAVTPGASTALQRVALPWIGAQYTHVAVTPRNIEVPVGHSVEISGLFSGRPPTEPRLHWQVDSHPAWQAAPMTKASGSGGAFVHPLTKVTVPVKYRVSGGDALSPEFQVTPYLPPEVTHLSIGLAYPEYTGLKPVAQPAPDITVLRGSTATLHLGANVGLSRALLRFSDTNLAPVELRKSDDGRWTGSLTIVSNGHYHIELFDQKGRKGGDDMPHPIVATTDAPPKVEILEPGQDMRAEATNSIPIRVSVADDYGVAGINLVYHKLNGAEQTVACQTESAKNGEWIATAEIDLAPLGLTRYDVVVYHAEARDNNTLDGPGIGRSALYFIEITDKASGPAPPPQPMPGEQVNLLVVQKQIIADTVALDANSPATNYIELAWRQTNAVELGRLYLGTMTGAPAEAVSEMNSAIASMDQAIAPLSRRDRAAAVPPEEAALAHLYRVLALVPDLKLLAVTPKPQMPMEQKPQKTVALREIRKPADQPSQVDPEIETALQEARELSLAQAELNAIGEKFAKAESRGENSPAADSGENSAQPQQAMSEGEGKGPAQGQGQGEGQGEGQGQGDGKGVGEKPPENPEAEKQFAKNTSLNTNLKTNANATATTTTTNNNNATNANANTNSLNLKQPSSPQANRAGATNDPFKRLGEPKTPKTQKAPGDAPKPTQLAKSSPARNAPAQAAQFAQAQKGNGDGAKPGKGRGQGKGKAKAAGQKGKGQGTKPGDGSGKPSTQQKGEPTGMPTANPDDEAEPDTPEELAEKQEELSAEAKALGEMLQRLAGKGTRMGHNLAVSANKAAEHMEGAAQALKQGNAAGAGRRGTMSSAELDQLVTELERVLGQRPDLTDVATEEAPKEYEAFISEYFKKLSYEK